MEIAWIIIIWGIMLAGIAGCILPFLPGPPLSYVALVLQYFLIKDSVVSVNVLIATGIATAVVTALDFVIPIWGTKTFGGSKKGMWGATMGLIVGLFFFPPLGLFIGAALGAFMGELTNNANDINGAFNASIGTFIGFLLGTVAKVIVCIWMMVYLFPDTYSVWKNIIV